MPAQHSTGLTARDLAVIIAFLRQVPAVATAYPSTERGRLMRFLLDVGAAPDLLSALAVDRSRKRINSIVIASTAQYGAYLVDVGSCRICHRPDLKGGLQPLARAIEPEPPDLTRDEPI